MKNFIFPLVFLFVSLLSRAQSYEANLAKIAQAHPEIVDFTTSKEPKGNCLTFMPLRDEQALTIFTENDEIDWKSKKYLVLKVVQKARYSGILFIDFYKKGNVSERVIVQQSGQKSTAQITPKIGVMPNLSTQVIVPLSYLDGQDIFMERFPRQLKGTVLGRRLNQEDIGTVKLRLDPVLPPEFTPSLEITSIKLVEELPDPLQDAFPVVDQFGQWAGKEWAGKIASEEELKGNLEKLQAEVAGSTFPKDWSRYGGLKKKKFQSSGFFYTHHDGERWWLVDPEGAAFISAGVDCIDPSISGPVEGNEDLFRWLPEAHDPRFKAALSARNDLRMIDFLKANLIRVYGDSWETNWQDLTTNILKNFRFNTIGNWSNLKFALKAGIPYTIPLRDFPTTDVKLFRDFPDVFDPVYKERAVEFAQQLLPFKDDPFLIGYFLSNEPHWAFGEHYIAFEMFGTSAPSHSKSEFISWILSKYGSLGELNVAWNTSFTEIEELEKEVFKESSELSDRAYDDMKEFSGVLVDEYVKVVCDEVKKVDPNHLNLGMRYAWISSELCYRAAAYFDVFSINGYNFPGPPDTQEIAKRSGKPVMIGEYHFGSIDRGLPASGIQGAETQKARGDAYRYYLENGFSRPEIIGLHYFQWNDQPIMGRFDGENYNIGLFDVCNQPYIELLNAAKDSHERMYKVAMGARKPYKKVIKKMPPIFY